MGKKGSFQELVLGPLFPLIIAFVVFLLMLNYTSSVAKSSYFEREFMSRDVGLLIESIEASPGSVSLTYPQQNIKNDITLVVTKTYVKTYSYDVDPKLAPSKTSQYFFIPSILPITELTAAPKVVKDSNGKIQVYGYDLYFAKSSGGLIPSSIQKTVPKESAKGSCGLLNTAVEDWYATKKVYIGVLPSGNSKTTKDGEATSQVFANRVCTSFPTSGFFPINNCNPITSSIDVKDADFIMLIYVNEDSHDKTIKVYFQDGQSDASSKSQEMGCFAENSIGSIGVKFNGNISEEKISDSLKPQVDGIAAGKPVIAVEIGNIEELEKADIQNIGKALQSAVEEYYR